MTTSIVLTWWELSHPAFHTDPFLVPVDLMEIAQALALTNGCFTRIAVASGTDESAIECQFECDASALQFLAHLYMYPFEAMPIHIAHIQYRQVAAIPVAVEW
jgi:hypothetical protein